MLPSVLIFGFAIALPAPTAQESTAQESTAQESTAQVRSDPILPQAISSFGAARSQGYAYVFGGHTGIAHDHSRDNLTGAFRRLNLADGRSWEDLPSGPPLQGTALVATSGGVLYRVGGLDAKNAHGDDEDLHSTATVDRFDPATRRWTVAAPLPEARSSHDAFVVDNRLYVIGGWTLAGDEDPRWLETAWVADVSQSPTELEWKSLPKPPFQRRAVAVTEWNGRVAVVGGMDDLGPLEDVALFDPNTGQWTDLDLLPGLGFGAAAVSANGSLFASAMDGRLFRLARPDAKWQTVGQHALPRFFHRFVLSGPARVLALGGAGRGGHMRVCEHLQLPSATPRFAGQAVEASMKKPQSDATSKPANSDGPTSGRPNSASFSAASLQIAEWIVPFPGATRLRHGITVRNNEVWITGGNRGGRRDRFAAEKFVNSIWKINLPRLEVTRVGQLPAGRQSMAVATLGKYGAQTLWLGGLGPDATGDQSSAVTLATGWVRSRKGKIRPFAARLPSPRTQFQLVPHGGKLFAIGGTDFKPRGRGGEASYPDAIVVCDPSADQPEFETTDIKWQHPRRSHACAKVGSKVYLIGGLADGFHPAKGPDVLDLATGSWSQMAKPPSAWVSAQAAVLDGKVYVAGGGTMRGQRFTEDRALWRFDPSDNSWRKIVGELPFPTRHTQMRTLRDRLLFVSIDSKNGGRAILRTLKPDPTTIVVEPSFHH